MTAEEKLKRLQIKESAKVESIKAQKDVVLAIIGNPLIDLVTAFVVVEYLQKHGYMGFWSGAAVEAAVTGVATAQALAPIAPALLESGEGLAKLLTVLN